MPKAPRDPVAAASKPSPTGKPAPVQAPAPSPSPTPPETTARSSTAASPRRTSLQEAEKVSSKQDSECLGYLSDSKRSVALPARKTCVFIGTMPGCHFVIDNEKLDSVVFTLSFRLQQGGPPTIFVRVPTPDYEIEVQSILPSLPDIKKATDASEQMIQLAPTPSRWSLKIKHRETKHNDRNSEPAVAHLLEYEWIPPPLMDSRLDRVLTGGNLNEGVFVLSQLGETTERRTVAKALRTGKSTKYSLRELRVMLFVRDFRKSGDERAERIVEILGHNVEDQENPPGDIIWILMPLYEGLTMDHRIGEPELLEREVARILLSDVVSGVMFLHSIGCVHLDIKPLNVALTAKDPRKGRLVIIDMGSSFIGINENSIVTGRGCTMAYAPNEARIVSKSKEPSWSPMKWDVYTVFAFFYEYAAGRKTENSRKEYALPNGQKIGDVGLDDIKAASKRFVPDDDKFSKAFVDITTMMWDPNPTHRRLPEEGSSHPFFSGAYVEEENKCGVPSVAEVLTPEPNAKNETGSEETRNVEERATVVEPTVEEKPNDNAPLDAAETQIAKAPKAKKAKKSAAQQPGPKTRQAPKERITGARKAKSQPVSSKTERSTRRQRR